MSKSYCFYFQNISRIHLLSSAPLLITLAKFPSSCTNYCNGLRIASPVSALAPHSLLNTGATYPFKMQVISYTFNSSKPSSDFTCHSESQSCPSLMAYKALVIWLPIISLTSSPMISLLIHSPSTLASAHLKHSRYVPTSGS